MLKFIPMIFFLLLAGCQSVSVNVSHANTDKGFLNSRQLDVGKLFLFDTSDDTLIALALLDLQTVRSENTFATVKATNISGVTINGSIDTVLVASVKSAIASKAFIELTNANRVEYKSVYNDLSRKIRNQKASGNDVGITWFLKDAASKGSPLRLVLVTGAITADSSRIGFNSSLNSNGKFSIPNGKNGSLEVNVEGSSSEEYTGIRVPVLLDLSVIEVFYNDRGNFDFRPDRKFRSPERLTAALRKL